MFLDLDLDSLLRGFFCFGIPSSWDLTKVASWNESDGFPIYEDEISWLYPFVHQLLHQTNLERSDTHRMERRQENEEDDQDAQEGEEVDEEAENSVEDGEEDQDALDDEEEEDGGTEVDSDSADGEPGIDNGDGEVESEGDEEGITEDDSEVEVDEGDDPEAEAGGDAGVGGADAGDGDADAVDGDAGSDESDAGEEADEGMKGADGSLSNDQNRSQLEGGEEGTFSEGGTTGLDGEQGLAGEDENTKSLQDGDEQDVAEAGEGTSVEKSDPDPEGGTGSGIPTSDDSIVTNGSNADHLSTDGDQDDTGANPDGTVPTPQDGEPSMGEAANDSEDEDPATEVAEFSGEVGGAVIVAEGEDDVPEDDGAPDIDEGEGVSSTTSGESASSIGDGDQPTQDPEGENEAPEVGDASDEVGSSDEGESVEQGVEAQEGAGISQGTEPGDESESNDSMQDPDLSSEGSSHSGEGRSGDADSLSPEREEGETSEGSPSSPGSPQESSETAKGVPDSKPEPSTPAIGPPTKVPISVGGSTSPQGPDGLSSSEHPTDSAEGNKSNPTNETSGKGQSSSNSGADASWDGTPPKDETYGSPVPVSSAEPGEDPPSDPEPATTRTGTEGPKTSDSSTVATDGPEMAPDSNGNPKPAGVEPVGSHPNDSGSNPSKPPGTGSGDDASIIVIQPVPEGPDSGASAGKDVGDPSKDGAEKREELDLFKELPTRHPDSRRTDLLRSRDRRKRSRSTFFEIQSKGSHLGGVVDSDLAFKLGSSLSHSHRFPRDIFKCSFSCRRQPTEVKGFGIHSEDHLKSLLSNFLRRSS
ncbi:hypothetical protein IE53DRAFT_409784 [Violaceomyces palustris]|uniref:Uncharacterized protein n=1 Tax=Violaceomyces palustris TaxID=1673888 RepID=A0ACD0P207_9BASI|nr:hypothetical protein IE53DRAFT_409784 [Violaceomyces palustris]